MSNAPGRRDLRSPQVEHESGLFVPVGATALVELVFLPCLSLSQHDPVAIAFFGYVRRPLQTAPAEPVPSALLVGNDVLDEPEGSFRSILFIS